MKKLLLLAICVGCIIISDLYSQSCAPKGISTDPASPINPDPNGRINTFNYTATGWPLRTEYLPYDTYKQSPFYSDNNSAIQHLYAPNDGVLDILPSNGWEIIKQDFGYLDNGQPSLEKAKNPFIVLYNRYTGKMRVFIARYSQQNFNGANITVRFTTDSPMQTSLFDFGSSLKAIDASFIRDQQLRSIVNFPTGPFEWFYSDFQMQYDPCTCFFTSKIEIKLSLSNTSIVTLTGSSTGTITAIDGGAPTESQNNKGPLSFGNLITGAKKGIQGYKSGQEFKNDIQEAINKEGGSKTSERTSGLTNLVSSLSSNKFLKAGLSSIPYVSAALSVVNFFNGGGKEGPQQVTITPMSIRQSYDFSGTIGNEFPDYATITFRNPGSLIGNSPLSQYPYYNEVMGIFNLLTTPRFTKTVVQVSSGSGRIIEGSYWQATFKLAQDAQYVLNPAAKLSIQEIKTYLLINHQGELYTEEFLPNNPEVTFGYADGGPTPNAKSMLVVLNLRRLNTNDNTQNILLSLQYPVSITSTAQSGATVRLATNVDAFCNSSTYKSTTRFPAARSYEDAIKELEKKEWEEETKRQGIQEGKSLNVYPNPSTNTIHVDYGLLTNGSVKISLTNLVGVAVTTLKNSGGIEPGFYNEDFNIENISPGIYYLIVEINGQRATQKIVINR